MSVGTDAMKGWWGLDMYEAQQGGSHGGISTEGTLVELLS